MLCLHLKALFAQSVSISFIVQLNGSRVCLFFWISVQIRPQHILKSVGICLLFEPYELKTVGEKWRWWTQVDHIHCDAHPGRHAAPVCCCMTISITLSLHDLGAAFDRRNLSKLLAGSVSSALLSFFYLDWEKALFVTSLQFLWRLHQLKWKSISLFNRSKCTVPQH